MFGKWFNIYRISSVRVRKYSKLSYIHNVGTSSLKPLTVGQLLEISASKFGDREAVISCHQKSRITFKETLYQSDRLAAGLAKIGLKPGDRLGLWASNYIEWYISFLASARAGLILVALNPAYQAKELEYCINKVGIKGIICSKTFKTQDYYRILSKIAPELNDSKPGDLRSPKVPTLQSIISMSDDHLKGAFRYEDFLNYANEEDIEDIKKLQKYIKIDDTQNIQFTSGTTGQPKAALVTHFSVTNNSYYIGKRSELSSKHQKICVQVPLFHAFGTIITLMAAVNHGATLVFPSEIYNPERSLDALKNEKCSVIHGTPTMYIDLVDTQRRRNEDICAEIAISGGALCPPSLFTDMKQVLKLKKVKSVYGLTETTAVVFHSDLDDDEHLSTTTVGKIGEHVEVKVVDEQNNIVPFGTPGELCVRGYFTMLGYWNDEAKTKETIGADKWLKTGDQFVLNENGYGKVVGRLKEMIIRGGENIFPKEIEDFLNTHEDILEVYVIGLPHERLGEEVCACIRVKNNAKLSFNDIVNFCKGNIAHFKIPSKVEFMDDFPKTTSGKIQKFLLIKKVLNK